MYFLSRKASKQIRTFTMGLRKLSWTGPWAQPIFGKTLYLNQYSYDTLPHPAAVRVFQLVGCNTALGLVLELIFQ